MKRKKSENDMPYGKLTRIEDFLPSPSELAMPDETVKITISLSRSSVDFFRHEAKSSHTKYQRLIRKILDRYAMLYQKAS
ncbi:MAG: CopG family transcriptional regulator [Chlamydiae bacterium]|nr:CopG family transcriptional regulator [Chlamydiota bacterium]MBI3267114.1 CopG family transcriptional regulator [Chlamydiota bacterium]